MLFAGNTLWLHEGILSRNYLSSTTYFDDRSRDITWLVSRRLNASCALVLSDLAGRLCVLDITLKDKTWRLIGVYEPNANCELPNFFRHIEPYMIPSRQAILVGDWNVILDPNLDQEVTSSATNTLDPRHFHEVCQLSGSGRQISQNTSKIK